MSTPVIPLTYPYNMGVAGILPEEIAATPKPAYDKALPSADTIEAKERLKKATYDTLTALVQSYRNRIRPSSNPQLNMRDYTSYPANEQDTRTDAVIHITGKPETANITGLVAIAIASLVLIVGLSRM
jgi:hypothetical protein